MIPAEWILVTWLYVLLAHEVASHIWKSSRVAKKSSVGSGGAYRASNTGHNRCRLQTASKKSSHSLDALWKRMKQATETFRLSGMRHDLVTQTMAQARKEARRLEAQKIAAARAVDMGLEV